MTNLESNPTHASYDYVDPWAVLRMGSVYSFIGHYLALEASREVKEERLAIDTWENEGGPSADAG